VTFVIGTPHRKNAGYFINDKDLSTRQEADIQTCKHCQAIIKMQEWKEDGGFCRRCMAPICGPCGDRMLTHGCEPFIKRLEQHIDMTIKLERFMKMAGLEPVSPSTPLITGR